MPSLAIPPTAASDRARRAARARWGEPRVIRLDTLTPEQRRLVLALVDAAHATEKAAPAGNAGTAQEVDRADRSTPTP